MWFSRAGAGFIAAVQVKEEQRRVSEVVIKVASSYLAKRDGGWREAAIIQTRVYGREVRLSRQEVGVIGPEGHSTVGRGQPVKGISHICRW